MISINIKRVRNSVLNDLENAQKFINDREYWLTLAKGELYMLENIMLAIEGPDSASIRSELLDVHTELSDMLETIE